MNHYEVLGIGPNATDQQIKDAYRREAMKWHPDRHDGAVAKSVADQRFKDLAVAYRTLRNPVDRANYDRQLEQKLRREFEDRQRRQAEQERAQTEEAKKQRAQREPPHPEFADTGPQFEEQSATNDDANQMFYEQMLDLAVELAGRGFPEFNIYKALIALGCPEALAKTVAAKAGTPDKADDPFSKGKSDKPGSQKGTEEAAAEPKPKPLRRPISTDWESMEPYFEVALLGPNFQPAIDEEFGIIKAVRWTLFLVVSMILFALFSGGGTSDSETLVTLAIFSALAGWGITFGLLELSQAHRDYVLTERWKNYLPKFEAIFRSTSKWKDTSSAVWFPAPWFGYYGIIWPLIGVASIFFAIDFLLLSLVDDDIHQKQWLVSIWKFANSPMFFMCIWGSLGYYFNYFLYARIKSEILKINSFQAAYVLDRLHDKCRPRLWRAYLFTVLFLLLVNSPSAFIFPDRVDMAKVASTTKALSPDELYERAKPRFADQNYKGPLSVPAAMQMLYMAADKKDSRSESLLGYIHAWGKGVRKNEKVGRYWIERAANQGEAWSVNVLGDMKYHGIGGYKDEGEALAHWRNAAEMGSPAAQTSLGWAYMTGIGGSAIDFYKAVYWNEKAANGGNAEGFNNLGWLYENGRGVARNAVFAASMYKRAAELGSDEARQRLLALQGR